MYFSPPFFLQLYVLFPLKVAFVFLTQANTFPTSVRVRVCVRARVHGRARAHSISSGHWDRYFGRMQPIKPTHPVVPECNPWVLPGALWNDCLWNWHSRIMSVEIVPSQISPGSPFYLRFHYDLHSWVHFLELMFPSLYPQRT